MKVYFVRHGESLANSLGQHAGWAQVPLTEKGEGDALRAKAFLEGLEIDAVYSSDTLRAIQTAAIAMPGREPVCTPLLRELHVGQLAGKTAQQCREQYGELYPNSKAVFDYTPFGGEKASQQLERAVIFLKQLETSGHRAPAVFSHEGTLRCLYNYVQGLPAETRSVRCRNGGVCIFSLENGVWSVDAWDQP